MEGDRRVGKGKGGSFRQVAGKAPPLPAPELHSKGVGNRRREQQQWQETICQFSSAVV